MHPPPPAPTPSLKTRLRPALLRLGGSPPFVNTVLLISFPRLTPPPTASATGLCTGSRGGGEVPPGPHRARSARGRQTMGKGCGLFRRTSVKSLLGKRGRMIKNIPAEKGAPGHRQQSTGASAMPAFCPFLSGCVRVEGKGAAGGTALKAAETPERLPAVCGSRAVKTVWEWGEGDGSKCLLFNHSTPIMLQGHVTSSSLPSLRIVSGFSMWTQEPDQLISQPGAAAHPPGGLPKALHRKGALPHVHSSDSDCSRLREPYCYNGTTWGGSCGED